VESPIAGVPRHPGTSLQKQIHAKKSSACGWLLVKQQQVPAHTTSRAHSVSYVLYVMSLSLLPNQPLVAPRAGVTLQDTKWAEPTLRPPRRGLNDCWGLPQPPPWHPFPPFPSSLPGCLNAAVLSTVTVLRYSAQACHHFFAPAAEPVALYKGNGTKLPVGLPPTRLIVTWL
jgi:hypothetical protein